jgi:tRNA A22 N-methylase
MPEVVTAAILRNQCCPHARIPDAVNQHLSCNNLCAGEVVAAKTQEAAAKVADAASEVAQKAKHDAAELAAVTKEAFSSSDAPSAPVAHQ